jgi:SAM-dependent methyltransferase
MSRSRLLGPGLLLAAVLFTPQGLAQDAERWDRIFAEHLPAYRTAPNRFLEHALTRLASEGWLAGKQALDVAMGDGRNALLLAERGFTVTGIDISPVALDKARAAAKAKGLTLEARQADVFAFDYGVERWDLISIVYFNPALDLAPALKEAVRPGGVIVIEGQGSEHEGTGPPPRTRFAPNSLLTTFADWRILAYEDGRFESDWNPGTPTHVVRLMARKPAPGSKP